MQTANMPRPVRRVLARVRTGVRAFLLSDEPSEWFWRTPGVGQLSGSGVPYGPAPLHVTGSVPCSVLSDLFSTLPRAVPGEWRSMLAEAR
jgi:hypothetical protein